MSERQIYSETLGGSNGKHKGTDTNGNGRSCALSKNTGEEVATHSGVSGWGIKINGN
jgi:hypothetical protein